jgi:RND superfamily putative drug exporter
MRLMASWCVRHRRLVLAGWLAALIGLAAIAQSVGSAYKNSFSLKGTQSFEALALLQRAAPRAAGDVEQVVFSVAHRTLRDPAARARVQALLARVAALPEVASVASPFSAGDAAQISRSGHIGFANVILDKQGDKFTVAEAKRFVAGVRAGAGPGLSVAVEGAVAEQTVTNNVSSAGFGAIAALGVLFLVFGSLLAAVLPLITAGFALGVGTAVVGLLSHLLDMASFSSELALLIGLGVGVDYALFIVTRHRQGLQQGKSVEDAIVEAIDTSGRAVMFAGITVCIALLGMFALGVSFLYGVAVAAAVVVAFTVFSALTLLPALLGFFGNRILGRRARRALGGERAGAGAAGGPWVRWTRVLPARPALIAGVGVLAMALIAIPFLSMRLGSSDAGSDPAGSTTRQAYDLLARGFGPGYNGPLQLVAQVSGPAQEAAFTRTLSAVAHTGGVVHVTPPRLLPGAGGEPAVISADAYPAGSPQAASTSALLSRLRATVVPRASAGSGLHVLVGGPTAIFADFASVLSAKLPLFIGVVVALSFLLLTAVFRSLVIPATAAVMNMLSAGAAFGVITAVFQWGWLSSVFGISTGPIEAFIPVMMFAILFGLSMDYEVFLLARIYEEWHRTHDNRLAVTRGLHATGKTITAAAAIMILVFGSFIFGGQVTIEMFGLGLAAAVLLDALIVRAIIVPAVMLVIGPANWALPARLERVLPHLNVEGATEREGPADPGPASEPREVVTVEG